MVGKKKAKCYKKIEVKVWFRRLGNADKYWLESFRDYTLNIAGEDNILLDYTQYNSPHYLRHLLYIRILCILLYKIQI